MPNRDEFQLTDSIQQQPGDSYDLQGRIQFKLRYQVRETLSNHDLKKLNRELAPFVEFESIQGTKLLVNASCEPHNISDSIEITINEISRRNPDLLLIEVSPDYVGLPEAAYYLGITKQAIHKMRRRHHGKFPEPFHEGSKNSVWHLYDILIWLEKERPGYFVPRNLVHLSIATKLANIKHDLANLEPLISDKQERRSDIPNQ